MYKYFSPQTDPKLFACSCGCETLRPDIGLLFLLEKIREKHGKPIRITSGPRCEAYNTQVGGASTSAHMTGKAADMACTNSRDRLSLVDAAIASGCRRIGINYQKGFVHVDVDHDQPEGLWGY